MTMKNLFHVSEISLGSFTVLEEHIYCDECFTLFNCPSFIRNGNIEIRDAAPYWKELHYEEINQSNQTRIELNLYCGQRRHYLKFSNSDCKISPGSIASSRADCQAQSAKATYECKMWRV